MDARLQANPYFHYEVNGGAGRKARPGKDDALQFLSQEEKECIQFFEDTIDSLEESLKEDDRCPGTMKSTASSRLPGDNVSEPKLTSPHPRVNVPPPLAGPLSSQDQDIIDLVRPGPDLVQTKDLPFSPTNPDFHSMMSAPESHIDVRPRRNTVDRLPSEYNPPLPSGSYSPSDSHPYHPSGSIPTPVLIAQKIAENQTGGTSNVLSSPIHRSSLEAEKPLNYSPDHPVKQGPPTSAKPSRFPANISVILGNKEQQNQSSANVNIHERRAQMLANLTGTSHPLLQEDPQQTVEQTARNIPTRSISFKDPTPDKSRMEALSKLGLNRNRAMSGGTSLLSDSTFPEPVTGAETSERSQRASVPSPTETTTRVPEVSVTKSPQLQRQIDRKAEILHPSSPRRPEERNPQPSPSTSVIAKRSFSPPPVDIKSPIASPPEVTSLEPNSYGGKSIVVNPSVSSRSEPVTPPVTPPVTSPEPKLPPPALANPTEFNTYGGKTKVMMTAPVPLPRNDLPDILSSHITKSQTLPAKSEPPPIEPNSYGGKSRTFNPSVGLNRPAENPGRSLKPPAPAPAPRPPRHSYHGVVTQQKAAQQALSPDHSRRSGSLFRPQGITVQFSGKGASEESRREALKKLGLLKDS